MLRVLLINAFKSSEEANLRFPHLGLGILAAVAKRELTGLDLEIRIVEGEATATLFKEFVPHIVGITAVSQNWNIALQQSDLAATLKIPIIFGGVHVSLLPETMPEYALAACIGEGERTFVELLRDFAYDELPRSRASIEGIAYWENGRGGRRLIRTKPRALLENLDDSPRPDYSLLKKTGKYMHLFTSRGCPFRCVFCSSTRYWNKVRYHSAERVVSDIRYLRDVMSVELIYIFDDLFAANRERLKTIVDMLESEKIAGKIKFTMNIRASIVDEELASLLKRMGVLIVSMGLESGNDIILQYLKGENATVQKSLDAILSNLQKKFEAEVRA